MDFDQRIHDLLRSRKRTTVSDDWTPFSHRFDSTIAAAMQRIERVLRTLSRHLPGSTVIEPGPSSLDPSFYVAALRIPSIPDLGLPHALRLFLVMFPNCGPSLSVQIVRVIAIGQGTQVMTIGGFLRAWHDSGIGGAVVYEGDAKPESVQVAAEQGALRFLLRRQEIMDWYERGHHHGKVLVWPIDPNYKPQLCHSCLLPVYYGPKCPKCGAFRDNR